MSNVVDLISERAKTHGDWDRTSDIAQGAKEYWRSLPEWKKLNHRQREALEMQCSKQARMVSGVFDHPDHHEDFDGYQALAY